MTATSDKGLQKFGISFLRTVATAFLLLGFSSCVFVVPHPMTTKDKSITGEFIKPDLAFAKIGATTRADIQQHLAPFNVGYKNDRLFWARWAESKSGISGGIALPYGGGAAGTSRYWSIQNVFFVFDQSGVLTSVKRFDDSKLPSELASVHAAIGQPAPDFSLPADIAPVNTLQVKNLKDGKPSAATIRLSLHTLEMDGFSKADAFSLTREEIRTLKTAGGDAEKSCLPDCTAQTLHFTRRTPAGKKAVVQFSLPDFDIFVWWMQLSKS